MDSIKVLQYVEGSWPQETLAHLWFEMMKEGTTELVWATGKRQSLNDFIRFFDPIMGRALFIVLYTPEEEETNLSHIVGAMWLSEIEVGVKAWAHFVFLKRFWSKGGVRGGAAFALRKGSEIAFSPPLDLQVVMGRINEANCFARELVKRIGMTELGCVPNFYRHGEQTYGVAFYFITREQFLREQQNVSGRSESDIQSWESPLHR